MNVRLVSSILPECPGAGDAHSKSLRIHEKRSDKLVELETEILDEDNTPRHFRTRQAKTI